MRKTGRNDPCPCGSGKKYKKCCMMKDKARQYQDAVLHAHQGGAEKAIAWLSRRFGDEMDAWMAEDWFDSFDMEDVGNLSQDEVEMMEINAMEMMLAEGSWVRESGEEVVFLDQVLGRGGPLILTGAGGQARRGGPGRGAALAWALAALALRLSLLPACGMSAEKSFGYCRL